MYKMILGIIGKMMKKDAPNNSIHKVCHSVLQETRSIHMFAREQVRSNWCSHDLCALECVGLHLITKFEKRWRKSIEAL